MHLRFFSTISKAKIDHFNLVPFLAIFWLFWPFRQQRPLDIPKFIFSSKLSLCSVGFLTFWTFFQMNNYIYVISTASFPLSSDTSLEYPHRLVLCNFKMAIFGHFGFKMPENGQEMAMAKNTKSVAKGCLRVLLTIIKTRINKKQIFGQFWQFKGFLSYFWLHNGQKWQLFYFHQIVPCGYSKIVSRCWRSYIDIIIHLLEENDQNCQNPT